MAPVKMQRSRRSKIQGLVEGPRVSQVVVWRRRALSIAWSVCLAAANLALITLGYEQRIAPDRLAGLVLFCGILACFLSVSADSETGADRPASRWGIGIAVLMPLLLLRISFLLDMPRQLVPTPLFAACFGMIYGRRIALTGMGVASVSMAICCALRDGSTQNIHFPMALLSVVGSALAILGTEQIKSRKQLTRLGFYTGLAMAIAEFTGTLYTQGAPTFTVAGDTWKVLQGPLLASLNGLLFGYILFELLPYLEKAFGVVPDVRLLDIGDLNQDFFRRFKIEAPGTYHHSQMVGVLAEAAAQNVSANALLAKVGAYYHDIGKLYRPEYFTENNLGGPNRHMNLTPQMSTLIIIAHTKDGQEIARELNLPPPVLAFIPEHHGTSCVEYFYHRAVKEGMNVTREQFRYPGPKPQSPESGIVMIADSIEAISRSVGDPTPNRLESIVHEVVIDKLMDGQLDESDLTLSDLKIMEDAFYRVLLAILHSRIKYPEKKRSAQFNKALEASLEDKK